MNTKELELVVSPETLILDGPHGRLWIRELTSLSDDGETLFVNVGVEKAVTGGGVVHYYLAALTLKDRKLQLIAALKDIHF